MTKYLDEQHDVNANNATLCSKSRKNESKVSAYFELLNCLRNIFTLFDLLSFLGNFEHKVTLFAFIRCSAYLRNSSSFSMMICLQMVSFFIKYKFFNNLNDLSLSLGLIKGDRENE